MRALRGDMVTIHGVIHSRAEGRGALFNRNPELEIREKGGYCFLSVKNNSRYTFH